MRLFYAIPPPSLLLVSLLLIFAAILLFGVYTSHSMAGCRTAMARPTAILSFAYLYTLKLKRSLFSYVRSVGYDLGLDKAIFHLA
jgi:hypothetical protein